MQAPIYVTYNVAQEAEFFVFFDHFEYWKPLIFVWINVLITESSAFVQGASVRPGAAGLLTGIEYSRVGRTAWVLPTSTVTTRTAVELA